MGCSAGLLLAGCQCVDSAWRFDCTVAAGCTTWCVGRRLRVRLALKSGVLLLGWHLDACPHGAAFDQSLNSLATIAASDSCQSCGSLRILLTGASEVALRGPVPNERAALSGFSTCCGGRIPGLWVAR
jgi:hypothetical protein